MREVESALDVLEPGERGLCVYTRGPYLSFDRDGSGSSGWWILNPHREVDKVIIYLRSSHQQAEVYVADWLRFEARQNDIRRFKVYFLNGNVDSPYRTVSNWFSFANTGAYPVRYLDKPT
jgi:hypothetical protein